MSIEKQDKEIYDAIIAETKRQQEHLELIPSENYASLAVREASGSVFTNKYSEGYPGKRYYGGQEHTDTIEELAIERACKLFNASFVNVQPHSGAQANMAVYHALLELGDTVLAMDLSHGGHLTHGSPVTASASHYNFVHYRIKDIDTGELDYDEINELAHTHKPKLIIVGYSSYTREPDYKKFVEIAEEIEAYTMADMAHVAGLIAGGVHRNPLDMGFDVMTTTTHKTLRGPRGGLILISDNSTLAKKINSAVFPGTQGGPHMHTIAAKAIAFEEAFDESFKEYVQNILDNAKAMEEVFSAHNVTMIGGGTSNHMLLIDVSSFGVSGKEAQEILERANIVVNKNVIPGDSRPPSDPSGIRLGTPAITTRGFNTESSREIAELIVEILKEPNNPLIEEKVQRKVQELAHKHPISKDF
jgi:glycine hydroxymethyltransferase